jgi:hypothetical protein
MEILTAKFTYYLKLTILTTNHLQSNTYNLPLTTYYLKPTTYNLPLIPIMYIKQSKLSKKIVKSAKT